MVTSYAVGVKDLVIIASFANDSRTSVLTKCRRSIALRRSVGNFSDPDSPGTPSDLLLRYMLKKQLGFDPNRDVKILPLGEARITCRRLRED